ncbi:ABC transporter ATP-binding protein [Mycoplasmopsis gallinarum]
MFKLFKLLSKKVKGFAFITICLSIVQPFLAMLIPSITKQIIYSVANKELFDIQILFWTLHTQSTNQSILYLILITISTALLLMLVAYFSSFFALRVAIYGSKELREILFKHLLTFSRANYDKLTSGTILSRFSNDMRKIRDGLNTIVRSLFLSPLLFIWGLVFALNTNLYLSISIFIIIPFLSIGTFLIVKKLFPLYAKENRMIDKLNDTIKEDIQGINLIKSYNLENVRQNIFEQKNNEAKLIALTNNKISSFAWPIMDFISLMGNAFLFFVIAFLVQILNDQSISKLVGDIYQFSTYLTMTANSIFFMMFTLNNLFRSSASSRRYWDLLNTKSEIPLVTEPIFIESNSITFKNVSFKYPLAQKNSLENISFHIKPNEKIGIIGKTGSGKTTLFRLIAREYLIENNNGIIEIGNIPIEKINSDNLYKNVVPIFQKPLLFSGTIKENLTFSNSQNDYEEALFYADADFVYEKTETFDFQLSAKASNLSGGQKQRLAIAQAIIKKPKILLIDDSTSALDNKTDLKVRENIFNNFQDSTILIIAQRINSIKNCDRIMVLDDGKISDFNTHENLLKSNLIYQEIFNSQIGENNG